MKLTHANASLRLGEVLVRRAPHQAMHVVVRAVARAEQGWARLRTGQVDEGLRALTQARTEMEELVRREPANDQFRPNSAQVTAIQATALAGWSADPEQPVAERRRRLAEASKCLADAETFSEAAKSKLAERILGVAKDHLLRARQSLENANPDSSSPL